MSAMGLEAPTRMSYEGDTAAEWKRFKERYEPYLIATGIDMKEDRVKCATLKVFLGDKGLEIYKSFKITKKDEDNYEKLLKLYDTHFLPKRHTAYSRYLFGCIVQQQGQSLDDFFTQVKVNVQDCGFGKLESSIIRDKIISGLLSSEMRGKLLLLDDKKLTLENTIKTCKRTEAALNEACKMTDCRNKDENQYINVNNINRKESTCRNCRQLHPPGIYNCSTRRHWQSDDMNHTENQYQNTLLQQILHSQERAEEEVWLLKQEVKELNDRLYNKEQQSWRRNENIEDFRKPQDRDKDANGHVKLKIRSLQFENEDRAEAIWKPFSMKQNRKMKTCKYCGKIHTLGINFCQAFGKTCKECGKQNHIASVCQSRYRTREKDETKENYRKQSPEKRLHESEREASKQATEKEAASNATAVTDTKATSDTEVRQLNITNLRKENCQTNEKIELAAKVKDESWQEIKDAVIAAKKEKPVPVIEFVKKDDDEYKLIKQKWLNGQAISACEYKSLRLGEEKDNKDIFKKKEKKKVCKKESCDISDNTYYEQ